jgi:hypothetical protein
MKEGRPNPPRVSDIRNYLLSHGWRRQAHENERAVYYASKADPSGFFGSLILPTSEDYSDATIRTVDAVRTLAEFENKPFDEMLRVVRSWDKDIFRARIFNTIESENGLPLDVAADTIQRLRQLVGYAAYTETDPKPHFEKAGSISNEFSQACRFGQTFEGSFGLNIECPLSLAAPSLALGDVATPEPPFERQVMERIATGFTDLRKAVSVDNIEPIVLNYHLGLNANLCRMLEDIYEKLQGRRIEYDFIWSGEVSSEVVSSWQPFVFEARAYEITRNAAEALEQAEDYPDTMVAGRIIQLKSDVPPGQDEQGEFEHVITVLWEREKIQWLKIRVPLTPSQYRDACDAHKDGKRIQISGVPEKQGKYWVLTKAHGFSVP